MKRQCQRNGSNNNNNRKKCIINKDRKQRQLKLNLSDERKMKSFFSIFLFCYFSSTDSNSNTSGLNFSVATWEIVLLARWFIRMKMVMLFDIKYFCVSIVHHIPTVSSYLVCMGCYFWFIGTFILVFIAFHIIFRWERDIKYEMAICNVSMTEITISMTDIALAY